MTTRPARILLICAMGLSACAHVQELDMTDAGVKARIEARLHARNDIDLKYITVDVHSGIATVSGLVPSWHERKLIERIVAATKGVQESVINVAAQE